VTKLRKHAAAIALAGLLALFGTACASDSGGESESEAGGTSEMASEAAS
jgi:Na+/H+-translocating membrane pyrophosphatase